MKNGYRLALVGMLCAAGFGQAQVPVSKALPTFKTSPGLELSIWASELTPEERGQNLSDKDLKEKPRFWVNPTCFDVDHQGRVWVCESINYRQKLRGEKNMRRPEGDRILILEDTKQAGQADKVTVFYQGPEIHSPLGIAVLPYPDKGQKVFVCQSPHLWVFEDKDGDGKADGSPSVLLTGFGGLDHDHGVHGVLVGPDNKLYFTVGDSGVKNLKASDGKGKTFSSNGTDCRAATAWRCDLDGKNLELLGHNFRNNYEPCVDSFGTVFLSDNDDDGNQQTRICYVMRGGDYGYHRNPKTSHWNEEHPGIVPKILRTYFGSPTGICMYEGNLLDKKFVGQILHTDAGPRSLRCYHLTPQGAAYSATQEEMVESSDSWYRPSDVAVAPDGSVFVADWYDPGVGGHGMGDILRGRIYRVAPKGNKTSLPKLDLKSPAGVIEALASPNLSRRAVAMSVLGTMDKAEGTKLLEGAATDKANPILRARALWQLARLGEFALVKKAFEEDTDERFKILAMRIAFDFKDYTPLDYTAENQVRVIEGSPAIRREALLMLQDADPAKAAPMIYELAKRFDGKDRFYLAAVGIAVGHHDTKRREAIFATVEKEFPGFDDKIAGLLWELRPPQASKMLQTRLSDSKLAPEQRGRVVDILADSGDQGTGALLLKSLPAEKASEVRERIVARVATNIGTKWGGLKSGPELKEAIESLLGSKTGQADAFTLIAAADRKDYLPKVIALAEASDAPKEIRLAALQTLGAFKDGAGEALLAKIAQGQGTATDELVAEAVRGLGRQGSKGSLEILRTLSVGTGKLDQRQNAVAGLASSKQGSVWLLEDFTGKKLAPDLSSDLSRLLRNSPFADIKNQANAKLPAPPKLDPKKLPSISALLTRKGNANKGSVVMERSLKTDLACLKCHLVNGQGGKVGPDLSVIGSKASRENLLESILYPSKAINHQFNTLIVETKDGLTITGIVVEESPTQIVMRDAALKEYKIAANNIETKRVSPISIMPDNLLTYMNEEELIDLVEYMYGLKSPAVGAR